MYREKEISSNSVSRWHSACDTASFMESGSTDVRVTSNSSIRRGDGRLTKASRTLPPEKIVEIKHTIRESQGPKRVIKQLNNQEPERLFDIRDGDIYWGELDMGIVDNPKVTLLIGEDSPTKQGMVRVIINGSYLSELPRQELELGKGRYRLLEKIDPNQI